MCRSLIAVGGTESNDSMLLTVLAKQVLSQPGEVLDHNFFFLDEFRELGKIESMSDWAGLGRSKGSCLILGFQDVFGVFDVYGKERAMEILGNCANIGIFHINSTQPETQKWASDVVGQHRYLVEQENEGHGIADGRHSENKGKTWVEKTEALWFPSLFSKNLPPTSLENGSRGLFKVGGSDFYRTHIQGWDLFSEPSPFRVPEPNPDFPDEVMLSPEHLRLKEWGEEDFIRLGIAGLREVAAIKPRIPPSVMRNIQEAFTQSPDQEGGTSEAGDEGYSSPLDVDELN